jgi:hypothetical protein
VNDLDISELLRQKNSAMVENILAARLGDLPQQLENELCGQGDQNSEAVNSLLHEISAILDPEGASKIRSHLNDGLAGKRMLAVCDFIAIPYSFNVLVFLFIAEKARQMGGYDVLDVAFLAHDSDPGVFSREPGSRLRDTYRTLTHNLGIQASRLLPSLGSVLFFDNRRMFYEYLEVIDGEIDLYPSFYHPEVPTYQKALDGADEFCFIQITDAESPDKVLNLTPPDMELMFARRWMRQHVHPSVAVTITLRNLPYNDGRNSDMEIWQNVVDQFQGDELMFVVVPEHADIYGDERLHGENIIYCDAAVITMPFRSAIYHCASVNLFENNGPRAMGPLSRDINYIGFNIATEIGSSKLELIKIGEGLEPGKGFWGAGPFQRLNWDTPSTDVIVRELRQMIDDLKDADCFVPAWYKEV